MGRSKLVLIEPEAVGRERQTASADLAGHITGRQRSVISLQPSFVQTITRRGSMSRVQADPIRYGDVRAEDIFPGSIQNIHIGNLSADKITTGTLDAGLVTISSDDGKMTMANNIFQVKDATNTIQLTMGKYDGTNYGLAFGPTPASPNILITGTTFRVNTTGIIDLRSGSDITFRNSGNTVTSLIGYIINNFVIQGDSTNGVNIFGNGGNISLGETTGSYGGGSKVVFIPNRAAAPSSNPTGGGILYAEGGALVWRGSGGTTTTIAVA